MTREPWWRRELSVRGLDLRRFFFEPTSPVDLGVCRVLFFANLLRLYGPRDYALWADVPAVLWIPTSFFDGLGLSLPPAAVLAVLGAVWKVALVLGCLGLFTRPSVMTAFILGVYLLGLPQNFGKISHRPGLLVLILGILAFSRCGDAWSLDRWIRRRRGAAGEAELPWSGEYRWPIRQICVVMALVFMTAGVAKLRGEGWIASDDLRWVFITHHYYPDRELPSWGLSLAQWSGLCMALAAATVFIEAAAPLALVSRPLALVIVPGLFLMQLGNAVLLGVHRDFPWAVCYAFWVPWEQLGARFRSLGRGRFW